MKYRGHIYIVKLSYRKLQIMSRAHGLRHQTSLSSPLVSLHVQIKGSSIFPPFPTRLLSTFYSLGLPHFHRHSNDNSAGLQGGLIGMCDF